jgi:hypothetical protein
VSLLQFSLAPLGLTLRGLDPALNPYRRTLMRPTGDTLPLDWAPCREYLLDVPIRLWLDPARDYVVRRVHTQARQLDVDYRRVSGVWVPASWVVSRAAAVTETVEVLEVRLNEPQAAEQFALRFPPGCVVHDTRGKPPVDFLVEPDGKMRELRLGAEAARRPPPGEPAGPWYWQYKWLLAGLAVGMRLPSLQVAPEAPSRTQQVTVCQFLDHGPMMKMHLEEPHLPDQPALPHPFSGRSPWFWVVLLVQAVSNGTTRSCTCAGALPC